MELVYDEFNSQSLAHFLDAGLMVDTETHDFNLSGSHVSVDFRNKTRGGYDTLESGTTSPTWSETSLDTDVSSDSGASVFSMESLQQEEYSARSPGDSYVRSDVYKSSVVTSPVLPYSRDPFIHETATLADDFRDTLCIAPQLTIGYEEDKSSLGSGGHSAHAHTDGVECDDDSTSGSYIATASEVADNVNSVASTDFRLITDRSKVGPLPTGLSPEALIEYSANGEQDTSNISMNHVFRMSPRRSGRLRSPIVFEQKSLARTSLPKSSSPRKGKKTVVNPYKAKKRPNLLREVSLPFACTGCGHPCKSAGDLKRHNESTQHSESTYRCLGCLGTFTRKDSLIRHTKAESSFRCARIHQACLRAGQSYRINMEQMGV